MSSPTERKRSLLVVASLVVFMGRDLILSNAVLILALHNTFSTIFSAGWHGQKFQFNHSSELYTNTWKSS